MNTELLEKLRAIAQGELERSPSLATQLLELLNSSPSAETLLACDLTFEITKAAFTNIHHKLDVARSAAWVGRHTSKKKAAASAANGKKGGRPRAVVQQYLGQYPLTQYEGKLGVMVTSETTGIEKETLFIAIFLDQCDWLKAGDLCGVTRVIRGTRNPETRYSLAINGENLFSCEAFRVAE